MTYKVIITLQVTGEDGNVVDSRGRQRDQLPARMTFLPLQTTLTFKEHAEVETALAGLNALHALMTAARDL